jgi:hypothetical protein
VTAIIAARFAAQGFDAFFGYDQVHYQSSSIQKTLPTVLKN